MIRIAVRLLGLAALLSAPAALPAKDKAVVPLLAAPAALRADAAYLLLRTNRAKNGLFPIQHVLLRIPDAQEMSDYRAAKQAAYAAALPGLTRRAKGGRVPEIDEFEFNYRGPANSFVVDSSKSLEEGELRTVLLEVPPGTYVLYGSTVGGKGLMVCNCLGTVSFAARAGVISDVGTVYADKVQGPSPVPHLEDNLGPHMSEYSWILGQALVPPGAATPLPTALRGLPVEPARIEIVGEYHEPGASWINRLAPIPGILGYQHGRPFDLRTGQPAP